MDTKHEDQQIADSESYAKVAQMEAKLAMIKAAVAEKANQIKSKELELHIVNAERDEAKEDYYFLKGDIESMQAENAMLQGAVRLAQHQVCLPITC
jgi:hypothetical protein